MSLDNNLKLEILNNIAHLEGYRTCLYHYSNGLFQEGDVKDTIKSIDESIAHLRQELKKKKEEDTTAKCDQIMMTIVAPFLRGVFGTIFTILATLKVVNYIDWNWGIIFSPFLISPILGGLIQVIILKIYKCQ